MIYKNNVRFDRENYSDVVIKESLIEIRQFDYEKPNFFNSKIQMRSLTDDVGYL